MSNTFRVGDMTVHRIVEMECSLTPALEFLPDLKSELLEENKSWLAPSALDADGNLVLCFHSTIVKTARHTILVVADATITILCGAPSALCMTESTAPDYPCASSAAGASQGLLLGQHRVSGGAGIPPPG